MGKVSKLKLSGKDHPFKLDVQAFISFEEIIGKPFFVAMGEFSNEKGEVDLNKMDLRMLRTLAYVGLESGAYHKGEDFELTEKQVGHMMDFDDLTSLMEAFTEAMPEPEEMEGNGKSPKPNRAQRRKLAQLESSRN